MQISFLSLITPAVPSLFEDFRIASERLVGEKYELVINKGVSDQDYHRGSDISSSGVKLVRCSPPHFWAQYLDPQKEPIDSNSLCLARATHRLTLEPQAKIVKLSGSGLSECGVGRHPVYRGRAALEEAELVQVTCHSGQSPIELML